jgi:hypothetical protein
MTKEELDRARAKEAERVLGKDHPELVPQLAACLARENWTPPVAVDPDIGEAERIWYKWNNGDYGSDRDTILKAIKRGRELEREEGKR